MPRPSTAGYCEDAFTHEVAATGRSLVVWRRQGPDDLATALANLEPCVVISQGHLARSEQEILERLHIPLVEADIGLPGSRLPTRLQAECLQAYGHRRIGYLTTSDPSLQPFAEPRTAAFRASCTALGLPEPLVAAVPGGLSVRPGDVAAQLTAWTTDDDPVTAVACFNDLHAAVCLTAAQQRSPHTSGRPPATAWARRPRRSPSNPPPVSSNAPASDRQIPKGTPHE